MARIKALDHIKTVKNKMAKKRKDAQANRIRRRLRQKSKRVC